MRQLKKEKVSFKKMKKITYKSKWRGEDLWFESYKTITLYKI